MKRLLDWLDELPLIYLLLPAALLGIAPWPAKPQPHLVEKLRMLGDGMLNSPVDVFDLVLHSAPILLLILKLARDLLRLSRAR